MSEKHTHDFRPAKRGKGEACACGERFPCPGRTCGHLDCHEARLAADTTTLCHLCRTAVEGPHQGSWNGMELSGQSRAAHYCCRDKKVLNKAAHEARLGAGHVPEPCTHNLEAA